MEAEKLDLHLIWALPNGCSSKKRLIRIAKVCFFSFTEQSMY